MLAMFGFKVNEDNFMPLIIVLIGFYSLIWTNSIFRVLFLSHYSFGYIVNDRINLLVNLILL